MDKSLRSILLLTRFKTQALKGGGEVGVGEGGGATAISEVQGKSAERAANDNAINVGYVGVLSAKNIR